jgi:hypothetical protein
MGSHIEKIRWEEDYRVTEQGLVLEEARVRGNGAGMEVPDGAWLENGSWHYRRQLPPLQPLRLGRTPEAGDYQLCVDGPVSRPESLDWRANCSPAFYSNVDVQGRISHHYSPSSQSTR